MTSVKIRAMAMVRDIERIRTVLFKEQEKGSKLPKKIR